MGRTAAAVGGVCGLGVAGTRRVGLQVEAGRRPFMGVRLRHVDVDPALYQRPVDTHARSPGCAGAALKPSCGGPDVGLVETAAAISPARSASSRGSIRVGQALPTPCFQARVGQSEGRPGACLMSSARRQNEDGAAALPSAVASPPCLCLESPWPLPAVFEVSRTFGQRGAETHTQLLAATSSPLRAPGARWFCAARCAGDTHRRHSRPGAPTFCAGTFLEVNRPFKVRLD